MNLTFDLPNRCRHPSTKSPRIRLSLESCRLRFSLNLLIVGKDKVSHDQYLPR